MAFIYPDSSLTVRRGMQFQDVAKAGLKFGDGRYYL